MTRSAKRQVPFAPLPDSVLRAQEREAKAASHDVIKAFYRLEPLERAVMEEAIKKISGNRLVISIDLNSSPLLADSLTKLKPFKAKTGRSAPKITLAQNALARLAYYHRPVFREEGENALLEWHSHWISGYMECGDGIVLLSLEEKLLPHLKLLKTYLSKRTFAARFTSQYSVRLFQWAWPLRKTKLVKLSMEQLRELLGVNDVYDQKGKLLRPAILTYWPNLKMRALSRAMSEISEKTDLEIRLKSTHRGQMRRVVTLVFELNLRSGQSSSSG